MPLPDGQRMVLIQRILRPDRMFTFWNDDAEFYRTGVSTPRSNCILDAARLAGTGVIMRPVEEPSPTLS
jgi:hypothetical protein